MIDKDKYEEGLTSFEQSENKPLELYLFIDPICSDCWDLAPVVKKLQLEFGHYFTITHVVSGKLTSLNRSTKDKVINRQYEKTKSKYCIDCGDLEPIENPTSPYLASIAIKAAQLQGRRSGVRFFRKLQEYLFLKKEDITQLSTLIACAVEANLDVAEFQRDIHSTNTSHAFQCDLKITNEMEVQEVPTIVFFNNQLDVEGIKLSGVNSYEVYLEMLREILGEEPIKSPLPPLLSFLKHYQFVTTNDIAFVYNWPTFRVEVEMKKLLLRREVRKMSSGYDTVWYYNNK